MKKILLYTLVSFAMLFAAPPSPAGWGGFQMGLVNNGRDHWDEAMKDAFQAGSQYKLDRRYIYIDDTTNIKSYWTGTKNWSQDSFYVANNIKPAVVIYMLQRGGDSWSAIQAGMNDKTFMEAYFRYIALIADSTKGQQPIYVLEPDVWTYVLQNARERNNHLDSWGDITDNNFDEFCHINDLGFPWLEEFENKISNLPGAIIKTLKMRDPEAFAGILIGFWGFQPSTTSGIGLFNNPDSVIAKGAQETAIFADSLLSSTSYRGDFCGLEKNGQDAAFWTGAYYTALWWNNRQNAAWVDFAKTVSDSTNLPMIGWQISIGHEGLANVDNEYEDTFFPYFFNNTQDYIDAGFIGMMAGVAGQDRGTMAVVPGGKTYTNTTFATQTKGDEGWFYTNYATFNSSRPWISGASDTYHTIIAEVVPDTVAIDTTVYPAWDSTQVYSPAWGVPLYVSYEGIRYEVYQYANAGLKPDVAPYSFRDLGPETVIRGTVDNTQVYYKAGVNAYKNFQPIPSSGYGIDTIWVNGVAQGPTGTYTASSISENVTIKVRFILGGTVVPVNTVQQVSIPKSAVKLSGLRIHGVEDSKVSIYTVSGKKVYQVSLLAGSSFMPVGLSSGVYLMKVQSKQGIQTLRMKIGM